MNVLLIKPTTTTDTVTPSLGLGYLAASVRDRHNVRIVDGPRDRLNIRKLGEILASFKPDIVGFQLVSMDIAPTWRYLELIRDLAPDAITVLGGPHPSGEPADTLYFFDSLVDYCFAGEAEKGFSELADLIEESGGKQPEAKKLAGVSSLVWRDGGRARVNASHHEKDLDSLGFPAWDLLNPRSYPPSPHSAYAKQFPVATITATRGCPYDCIYCAGSVIQGKGLRYRSIDHVMEEIDLLADKYGVREIHLVDDNFTYRREYALEFCERLSSKHPNMAWTCPNGVRLDTLDEELLSAMKRSGCYVMAVGVESGSQRVLDMVRKRQTLDLVREKAEMIHNAGIELVGYFMFGLPGEKIEDMRETVAFSLSLPLIRAQYMFFHPYPGTQSYKQIVADQPERLRRVASSFANVAYVDEGLTEMQLKVLQRTAFMRFYFRPRQFAALFTSIRHPMQIYYIARRILRWMIFD